MFGAGKSFLIAVIVIFLVQLFELDASISSRSFNAYVMLVTPSEILDTLPVDQGLCPYLLHRQLTLLSIAFY